MTASELEKKTKALVRVTQNCNFDNIENVNTVSERRPQWMCVNIAERGQENNFTFRISIDQWGLDTALAL